MKKALSFLTALFLVVVIVFTGCSKTAPTPSPSPSPSPSPLTAAEIVTRSSEKMQTLNSFHFALDQVGGGTPIAMGIEMTKASGDVVKPDKLQATITGTVLGMSLEVKLIALGTNNYMTNPLNGRWETIPEQFKVLSVFDPGTGIAAIMKNITTPVKLADEVAGGVTCYHIQGNITSDSLQPIAGSAISGGRLNAEAWIGKEDFLVRHIKLDGQITETEKPGITRTLDLSAFNQAVDIQAPLLISPG